MNRRDAKTQRKQMKTEFTELTKLKTRIGAAVLILKNSVNSVLNSAPLRLCDEMNLKNWLPDMDLNHDKVIQSHLCYRYTIGQERAS